MILGTLGLKAIFERPHLDFTLGFKTLDGAIVVISSATLAEIFEWIITQSLIGLGLDTTLQNR